MKIHSKTHQIAMLRDMQIPKSEKKISWPENPGDAPGKHYFFAVNVNIIMYAYDYSLQIGYLLSIKYNCTH